MNCTETILNELRKAEWTKEGEEFLCKNPLEDCMASDLTGVFFADVLSKLGFNYYWRFSYYNTETTEYCLKATLRVDDTTRYEDTQIFSSDVLGLFENKKEPANLVDVISDYIKNNAYGCRKVADIIKENFEDVSDILFENRNIICLDNSHEEIIEELKNCHGDLWGDIENDIRENLDEEEIAHTWLEENTSDAIDYVGRYGDSGDIKDFVINYLSDNL